MSLIQSSTVALLYFCLTLEVTKYVEGRPTIQSGSDTVFLDIASSSTDSGLSLLRYSPAPHHQSCPFKCQSQVQVISCASESAVIGHRFPCLRKTIYFPDYQFITKGNSRTASWKRGI